jgi:hypothetical protein
LQGEFQVSIKTAALPNNEHWQCSSSTSRTGNIIEVSLEMTGRHVLVLVGNVGAWTVESGQKGSNMKAMNAMDGRPLTSSRDIW